MTTYRHTLTGARPPVAPEAWTDVRIEGTADLLVAPAEIETQALSPLDVDPASPQARTISTDLAPFPTGYLRLVFVDAGGQESAPSDLVASPANPAATAFATAEDIAARIGRDLTPAETVTVELLLEAAASVIANAAGKTEAWAAALDPVPPILRFVCIEVAYRVFSNPENLRSASEALGAYQNSRSYRDAAAGGLLLSPTEELLVRRVVHGRVSGSVRVESVIDEILDLTYGS